MLLFRFVFVHSLNTVLQLWRTYKIISYTCFDCAPFYLRPSMPSSIGIFAIASDDYFLHTGYEYPRVLPGLTILISPTLSHPGPDKNHANLMHWLYRKSRISLLSDVGFTADYVKKDVFLCKRDNVKNRMAVAGSVGFFKLE